MPVTANETAPGPVPLYLIPKAVSSEIQRIGAPIKEMHITRTTGHHYRIAIVREPEGDESND
jgi:hypothetical protein